MRSNILFFSFLFLSIIIDLYETNPVWICRDMKNANIFSLSLSFSYSSRWNFSIKTFTLVNDLYIIIWPLVTNVLMFNDSYTSKDRRTKIDTSSWNTQNEISWCKRILIIRRKNEFISNLYRTSKLFCFCWELIYYEEKRKFLSCVFLRSILFFISLFFSSHQWLISPSHKTLDYIYLYTHDVWGWSWHTHTYIYTFIHTHTHVHCITDIFLSIIFYYYCLRCCNERGQCLLRRSLIDGHLWAI